MSRRRPRSPDELRRREEDQQRKLADLNDRLLAELWALRTGEDWAAWLQLAARLPGHSFTNLLLISAQAPGATRVAGYQEWREQGRQVSSGEPGIPVLAGTRPAPSVTPPARQRRSGPRVPDQAANRPSRRRLAYLWDVTQTTGPPLPRMPLPSPGPAPSGAWDALTWLARREGFTVERAPCSTGTSLTAWDARRIRIQPDLDEPDAARALAHELGHVLLHGTAPFPPGTSTAGCRGIHKLEADSTAFIITARLGISTSPYTWPDVASWAGTDVRAQPAEVIKATGTRISTAAETIAAHLGSTLPPGHAQQASRLQAHSPGPTAEAGASRPGISTGQRDTGRAPRTRPQDLPGRAGTQPEDAERSRATTRHGSTAVTGIAAGEVRPLPGTPAAGTPQLAVPQQPSSYRPAGARSLVAGSPGKAAMPEPLNSTDIMLALRHGGAQGLTSLIQAIDDQSGLTSLPARLRPYRGTRAAGEPSEGARESVTAIPEGLRIDIAATPPRAGTVPWQQIIDAAGPGLTPARRQILLRAHQTILGYTDARTGFQVIGERSLATAAERELTELAEATASAAITTAWQAREPKPGPARTAGTTPASTPHPAGAMPPAAQDPGPALHSTGMTTASGPGWLRSELRAAIAAQTDGWALARIDRLASVLPPWPAERAVRVSRLESGDILQHPGHPDTPFRVLTARHDHGDVIEITGTLTRPAATKPADPITWQLPKNGNDDPLVGVLALPQSLRGLADEAGPSRPIRQAAPSPRPPERVTPARSPAPAPRAAADPPPGPYPHTAATASGGEAMASTASGAAGPPAASEDTGLDRELADVLAALTSRRPAQPAPAPETNGHPPAPPAGDIADINAAFARLRRELGLPAAEPGYDASGPAPGPAAIHHEHPAQSIQAGDPPAPPYEGFADINAAFAELRQALGLPAADPSHDPSGHGDQSPAPDADGVREMCDAIAEAQACATWYRDTPEWQRITRVSDAARALMAAIRETAADYWSEIRQDIRVRGFARTVAARTSLAIAGPAWVLASKLDKAGHQRTRAWRAAHGLHRAATSLADGLMHYIPPGNSDRIRETAQIISKLNSLPQNPQTQEASRHGGSSRLGPAFGSSPAALARTSFPVPISRVPPPRTAPGSTPRAAAQPAAHAQPARHMPH